MSWGATCRSEPRYLDLPSAPIALGRLRERGKDAGAAAAEGDVPSVRAAVMAACAAHLTRSGSHSPSRVCARQGRKVALPPNARNPLWRRGQRPRWEASTRSRAWPPGPVTGAAAAAARPPTPPPPTSRAVAEFSLPTPPSRWRLPLPATPSIVPCSRRRAVAILSPVPPPLADIYIAKIGPVGLRPSPHACSLRLLARPHRRAVPHAGRGVDPRPLDRLPGHRATLPQPAPVH